ncbi:MAG: DUF4129 domain-containing protein [Clostridia bacterium]|nr:DUF4129 domain-containing protein [Clostridia bacterium]
MNEKKNRRVSLEKETVTELIWELVSCWLLAVGVCLLLDAQFPVQAGVLKVLWQTAAAVAVTVLLTRRLGVFMVALEASAIGGILWLWLSSHAEQQLREAWEFINWWMNDMPPESPWYTRESFDTAHLLLHIGVSVLLFTTMRITRRMWPQLGMCGALWVYVLAVGNTSNSALATAAFLAGLFPLLARDQYRGRRLFSRKNKFSPLGGRWVASTASGVLCITIAAALVFTMPADTLHIRTRWCSKLTADFQSVTNWYTERQMQANVLDMHDMGLQAYNRVGGNLDLPEKQPLAKLEGDVPALVRVTTFDTFDGDNWYNEFETSYRPDSHWPEEQMQALSAPATESYKKSLLESVASTSEITVTLLKDSHWLLTAGYTTGIREHTVTKNPLQFNGKGQLFSYFSLPKGYRYTLKTIRLPTDRLLSDEELMKLASCSAAADPLSEDEDFTAHYTALPENFSELAQQLAMQETQGTPYTYEKAYRLSRYFSLSRGYSYTDTPGGFKNEETIVDKLLKSKRGHCVYYATAMAGMARSVGIPSRLAVGYRTVEAENGEHLVDASCPYAWVECYIGHLGWVPFDPTPRKEQLGKPNAAPPPQEQPSQAPDAEKENRPDDNDVKDFPDELESAEKKGSLGGWLLLIVLLLAAAGVAVRSWLIPRAYVYERVAKRYPCTRRQTVFYYRDILRQLAALGYALEPAETLGELLERLPSDEVTDEVRHTLQTVQAMLYGDVTPSAEEAAALAALWWRLDAVAKQQLHFVWFILRRRVLVPYICYTKGEWRTILLKWAGTVRAALLRKR